MLITRNYTENKEIGYELNDMVFSREKVSDSEWCAKTHVMQGISYVKFPKDDAHENIIFPQFKFDLDNIYHSKKRLT